jgi:hypothetical protein
MNIRLRIRQANQVEATECNGSTITEVALEGYYSGTFSTYYYIMSHAMLQDSEGNQIAIAKTDTDVVYIPRHSTRPALRPVLAQTAFIPRRQTTICSNGCSRAARTIMYVFHVSSGVLLGYEREIPRQ